METVCDVLGPVPCTVTVPDSGGAAAWPPPPGSPPPQLCAMARKHPSAAPSAIRRVRDLLSNGCDSRLRDAIGAISSRQAAKAAAGQPTGGGFLCVSRKANAEDEAVMVTIAVSSLPSAPTVQVTPASEVDALQVKLTVAGERL